jgi:hypothetical protein
MSGASVAQQGTAAEQVTFDCSASGGGIGRICGCSTVYSFGIGGDGRANRWTIPMSISEEEIVQRLTCGWIPLDLFCLMETGAGGHIIECNVPDIGPRLWLIENDEAADACVEYLLKRGARVYPPGSVWVDGELVPPPN